MKAAEQALSPLLLELRRSFDAAFAEPTAHEQHEYVDLLAIGIGGSAETCLVRIDELAGLYADRAMTAVPSAMSALVGISDFRGELVAVYDLCAVLGYPKAERARFMVRVRTHPLAFTFDRLLNHVRLRREHLPTARATEDERGHDQVHWQGKTNTIIHLTALASQLEREAGAVPSGEA